MALLRKLFYRKPPDGLLEICERVYVFDCCFTADAMGVESFKNYVEGIIGQIREHFNDASILVFNFRQEEEQSRLGNILSEHDMTIMDYPRQYDGCPLLTMEMIHHFLRSCESWLSLGPQNLLLMHCERGGWPVLAFMLAALFIYRKLYSGEQKTLDMVYKQAPRELLHFYSPLNPIPSQLRYLQYVSRRNVATEWPPSDRALTLDCIIIRFIPNFDGEGGFRPIFRIYGQDPLLVHDTKAKVLFSTPKRSKQIRAYKQAECELVKIDINCNIQGDVVLECSSLCEDMERERMMFRVMFNTAFIRSNILMLNHDEIDTMWDAKDLFPKNFRTEILFSEMDAATSILPVEFSCIEEKEGLPMEAFAKVQEIFSHVDWLDHKADAALSVLQQMNSANVVQERLEMKHRRHGSFSIDSERKHLILRRLSLERFGEEFQMSPRASTSSDQQAQPIHSVKLSPQRTWEDLQTSQLSTVHGSYYPPASTNSTASPKPAGEILSHDYVPVKAAEVSNTVEDPPHVRDPAQTISDESQKSRNVLFSSSTPPPPPPPPPFFPADTMSEYKSSPCRQPPALLSDGLLNLEAETSVGAQTMSDLQDRGESSPVKILTPTSCPPPPPPTPPPPPQSATSSPPSPPSPPPAATPPSTLPPPPPLPPQAATAPPPPPPPPAATHPAPPPLLPPQLASHITSSTPSTPPPPPPPTTFPVVSSTPQPPTTPPPPPPPAPPLKESPLRAGPPPPPPPPVSAGQASGPKDTGKIPPPPLLAGSKADPASQGSSPIPFVPPPPAPSVKGILNTGLGPSGNAASVSPSPPGPPMSAPGLAKGRGLSRTIGSRSNTKKLKPLHWLKLSRAVQGSIWAEAQKSGEATKAPEIDMSELESLFSASVPVPDGKKQGQRGSNARKPDKVQLIDHRRAYNCEIMLSKVKVPLHDLMSSVLALEDSALDIDQVENLIKFCPTKEEMDLLKGYNGEKEKLGRCEQFFLELMQVPRVESKLRVFSFKIQFRTQVSDLRRSLNIVNSAAEEIKNSVKLKRIMQTILQLGNALNQGTARGAAIGFRLDSLLKLTETRARNNKMTLMHYLCKVLSDKLPEVLDFSKDLSDLEPASKIQLKFLAEEMQAVSKGLEKVVQELALSENDGPVSLNFSKKLKEFLHFAESEVRSLASLYSVVGKNADGLILYFGEDPAKCPFEQVVSTLLNFVRMFNKAQEENRKQLELEMKKASDGDKAKSDVQHNTQLLLA